jgi:hypothetical protein
LAGLPHIHTRAGRGLWQEREQVVRDDLISYQIMIEKWWREFRESLENRFQQQSIVVRAHEIDLLQSRWAFRLKLSLSVG